MLFNKVGSTSVSFDFLIVLNAEFTWEYKAVELHLPCDAVDIFRLSKNENCRAFIDLLLPLSQTTSETFVAFIPLVL